MKFSFLFFILYLSLGAGLAANSLNIINKPIIFNTERVQLTESYRCTHYKECDGSIVIKPKMIVLHWTESSSLNESFKTFKPSRITDRFDIIDAGALNVSAHFLVDRDGTVYQLMPSNWMARHVIGLNDVAIGIENVGGVSGKEDLTAAQVTADAQLIRYLKNIYPDIHYLIGHYEYQQFKNTNLWKEINSDYLTKKADPGVAFMQKIREQVKDLNLLPT